MLLETKRLLLRPWESADAEALYRYARDARVGPIAGWSPHASVEESRAIIESVFSAPETYAVVPKTVGHPVGCVGLMIGERSNIGLPDTECELGYWIGVPFWGQGMIPEAARRLIAHGFEALGMEKVWCGYFDGNERSKRVQEKCGFRYQRTAKNVPCAIAGVLRTEHITCLAREDWLRAAGAENASGGGAR